MKTDEIANYARQAHAAAVSQYYQDEPPRRTLTQEEIEEYRRKQDLLADSIVERIRIARAHGRNLNE